MKRSFTLVELLIVVIVFGILATLGTARFSSSIERGKERKCRTNLEQLHKAAERFGYEKGNLPTVAEFDDITLMHYYGSEKSAYACPKYNGAGHEYYIVPAAAGLPWEEYTDSAIFSSSATVVRGRASVHKDSTGEFYFRSTKSGVVKQYI